MFEIINIKSGLKYGGEFTSLDDANWIARHLDETRNPLGDERVFDVRPVVSKSEGLSYPEMMEALLYRGAYAARTHWQQPGKYIWWEPDQEYELVDGTKSILKGHIRFKTFGDLVETGTQASTGGMGPDNYDWYLLDPLEANDTPIKWDVDIVYSRNNVTRTSQSTVTAVFQNEAILRAKLDLAKKLRSTYPDMKFVTVNISPAE